MAHVNNNRAWRVNQVIRQALFELEQIDIQDSDGNGAGGAEVAEDARGGPSASSREVCATIRRRRPTSCPCATPTTVLG
jgi:hypothetical protein